jgi:SAM-dependent methyltransferase
LIAGCGTSQAAKHALRWPVARVVGIDFSATSVRHTQELKQKHRLDNLEVHQLPLTKVGELGATFDQIVCTGVLHHLPDPDAGLIALRDVLAPGGVMHLMLYAPYGRVGVYMLQDFCRRLGIEATDEGIRELVTALGALPSGHPLGTLLREAPDFRSEAALADALLHPQDRAYSVPELFAFLERCGLKFARWVKQAPYSPHCGLMARLPQTARLARLPLIDQHAAAELFRGTISRHSVVVCRDDDATAVQELSFGGDAWRRYVPIRAPDTISVQERLPPGAAAVLINRSHSHTDIYLPIDAEERRLYDAVDGARTIGELAGDQEARERAGPFFQRLGWHDQVVFDASGSHAAAPV